jgi:hypothetical protein
MTKALATFGNGPMEPVLRLVLPTFEDFAQRHGYEVVVGTGREAPDRPASWSKVRLIDRLLETHDRVFWVDADAVILDASEDVPFDGYQALHASRTRDGRATPNCGVWAFNACERTRLFLREVWDCTEFSDHRWWENAAVLHLLGYDVESKTKVQDSPWDEGITWLGAEWNFMPGAVPTDHVRIKHYASTRNDARQFLIRHDLAGSSPSRLSYSLHYRWWKVRQRLSR